MKIPVPATPFFRFLFLALKVVHVAGTLKIQAGIQVVQLSIGIRSVKGMESSFHIHTEVIHQQDNQVFRHTFYQIIRVAYIFFNILFLVARNLLLAHRYPVAQPFLGQSLPAAQTSQVMALMNTRVLYNCRFVCFHIVCFFLLLYSSKDKTL